jgi:hypothetical protein
MFAKHGSEIMADIPNYTNQLTSSLQFSVMRF